MLQNPCKTLGFKKYMVYKISPWGGGVNHIQPVALYHCVTVYVNNCSCKVKCIGLDVRKPRVSVRICQWRRLLSVLRLWFCCCRFIVIPVFSIQKGYINFAAKSIRCSSVRPSRFL